MVGLFVFAASLNFILMLKSHRSGISAYLILALVLPHLKMSGLYFPYEVIGALPVVAAYLVASGLTKFRLVDILSSIYFVVVLASTAFAVAQFGVPPRWVALQGLLRFVIILYIAIRILDRTSVEKVIFVVLAVNAVVSAVQLLIPSSVDVIHNLYFRESRGVLAGYMELGGIPRSTGTFGSPVNLGAFCLISFALYIAALLESKRTLRTIAGSLLSTATGLSALSKSFILGAPIILTAGLFLHLAGFFRSPGRSHRAVSKIRLGVGLALVALAAVKTLSYLTDKGFQVQGYLSYLFDPLGAFQTRYATAGNLAETVVIFKSNWLVGVGMTTPAGEFVGDSSYAVVLHDAGLVGLLTWGLLFILLVLSAVRHRDGTGVLLMTALLLTGLGLTTFHSILGLLVICYIVSEVGFRRFGSELVTRRRLFAI